MPKNNTKMIKGVTTNILSKLMINQIKPTFCNFASSAFRCHNENMPAANDVASKYNNKSPNANINCTQISPPTIKNK